MARISFADLVRNAGVNYQEKKKKKVSDPSV